MRRLGPTGSDPAAAAQSGPPPRTDPNPAGGAGHDLAAAADERFASVCDELGILLARRAEPVAARVLPFGSEQVAMVEVRAPGDGETRIVPSPGAPGDAVTPGGSVLAAALPGAVAEGQVRSAVVFADDEPPVRWGQAGDEARLAALYAVVPHLGSFTATAGEDTYRVLRLPGAGVALVSEGEAAATWVQGWFAALLHAARFSFPAAPTAVVATEPERPQPDAARQAAVLEQLESECRRILAAAQEEARAIREAAAAESAAARPEPRARDADQEGRRDPDAAAPSASAAEELAAARREADDILVAAERARAAVLADARREAEMLRRETEDACAALIAAAREEAEQKRRAARREVKRLRRKLKRLRRDAAAVRSGAKMVDVVSGARRAADDLLADARRAADELVRDAARARDRAIVDATRIASATPSPAQPDAVVAVSPAVSPTTVEEAQRTAIALLTAATESVAAMSALLASVTEAGRGERPDGDPPAGSRLYFGD